MGESEIRRLDLERYVAGELDGSEKSGLEAHLAECSACSGYLAQLRGDREEFLGEHPFGSLRWLAERPQREPWHARYTRIFALPVLRPVMIPLCLLLFAGVILLPFIGARQGSMHKGDGISYKGAPMLSYLYKRGNAVHESSPGDRFEPGDAIQVFYPSKSDQFAALFSVDGRGTISFYQPDEKSTVCSIRTTSGTKLAWPKSIVLDETPGDELVVALLSAEPVATMQIEGWIGGLTGGKDLRALEKAIVAKPFGPQSSTLVLLLQKGK
jgi:hypothetical protein